MNIAEFIRNTQDYFEDFITRATHHSNGLEGNTLSMAETYALIFAQNGVRVSAEPREIYEAINHKYAIDYILNQMEGQLTEQHIIAIAKLVNRNINDIDGYRTSQVFLRGAEHIPPPAKLVKQQMMYFVHNYNHTVYEDVFHKLASTHIEFERIHPFSDGNGRTGRLLLQYECMRCGLAPPIISKDDKMNYINCIADMDVEKLADMLRQLSDQEAERMERFGRVNELEEIEQMMREPNTKKFSSVEDLFAELNDEA